MDAILPRISHRHPFTGQREVGGSKMVPRTRTITIARPPTDVIVTSMQPTMAGMIVLLCSVFAALTGCSSVPIPPTYTQEELKARCERQGSGVWHQDDLMGGFCEPQHS